MLAAQRFVVLFPLSFGLIWDLGIALTFMLKNIWRHLKLIDWLINVMFLGYIQNMFWPFSAPRPLKYVSTHGITYHCWRSALKSFFQVWKLRERCYPLSTLRGRCYFHPQQKDRLLNWAEQWGTRSYVGV